MSAKQFAFLTVLMLAVAALGVWAYCDLHAAHETQRSDIATLSTHVATLQGVALRHEDAICDIQRTRQAAIVDPSSSRSEPPAPLPGPPLSSAGILRICMGGYDGSIVFKPHGQCVSIWQGEHWLGLYRVDGDMLRVSECMADGEYGPTIAINWNVRLTYNGWDWKGDRYKFWLLRLQRPRGEP